MTQDFINNYEKTYHVNKNFLIKNVEKILPNEMQENALRLLKTRREKGFKHGFVKAATGTGKTFLSAFDFKQSGAKNGLFIAHRKEILRKSKETFDLVMGKGFSRDVNFKTYKNISDHMYFSTYQSIKNNLIDNKISLDAFDYIVIDESHRSGANEWQKISKYFSPNVFKLGMTATEIRTDGKNVSKTISDGITYELNIIDALNKGYLADFQYYTVEDKTKTYEITDNNKYEIWKNIKQEINKRMFYGKELKALVFVNSIAEADLLSRAINEDNVYKSYSVHSKSDIKPHEAILDIETNRVNILVTVDQFNEGVDIPSINTIVMYRKTDSKIIWLQQIGRGLRKYNDKYLIIHDFVGNSEREFERTISVTKSETWEETIKRIISGEIIDEGFNSIFLSEKSKDSIINSMLNYSPRMLRKNSWKKAIELIDKDIKDINYIDLYKVGFDVTEYRITIGSKFKGMLSFGKEEFDDDFQEFYKSMTSIPLSLGNLEVFEKISLLLKGETINKFNDERWNRLFSGMFNKQPFQKWINFSNNEFNLKKENEWSDREKRELKILSDFFKYKFENKIVKTWMEVSNSYTKEEIIFMSEKILKYKSLLYQQGQISLSNGDIILFNSVGREKNIHNNRVEKDKFIAHTKNQTRSDEITKLRNNEVNIYNFIRDEKLSKFDGNRFRLASISKDYVLGDNVLKESYEIIFNKENIHISDSYKYVLWI